MKVIECAPFDEIFAHRDPDTNELRVFNATQMYQHAIRNPGSVECIEIPIEREHAEFIRRERGIEQRKLDRLQEPYLSRPLVAVQHADQRLLTVDGHHRYVRKCELGHAWIRTYCYVLGQWERFLLEDLAPTEIASLIP